MTIDKRPSGSYRIRQMDNGKIYSVTVPYKPTKKEAYELIQDKINHRVNVSMTFEEAAKKYIKAKSNVLSPSTIRGYESLLRSIPDDFKGYDISEIDDYTVQTLVNDYATDHSPKTVANFANFIITVIRLFIPKTDISVTLPKKIHKEPYIPTVDDVKALLNASKGTEYYVPLRLATLSLRASEICALTLDDLKDDTLTINKALVRGSNGYVLKPTPKTDKSNRTIIIPHKLAELIRQQGYIYKNYPLQIDKYIRRTLPKLGIEHFSIHKLRHFFASYAHDLGYSDAIIQSIGGWSTDNVMKKVYRHAMNVDDAKKTMANDFDL